MCVRVCVCVYVGVRLGGERGARPSSPESQTQCLQETESPSLGHRAAVKEEAAASTQHHKVIVHTAPAQCNHTHSNNPCTLTSILVPSPLGILDVASLTDSV